ncbi:MAG: SDR family NAD(P)-dependent oxidoreductase [Proteobacteria bacterium]|nr:SDR family NAD(P)-dependent oxidoreductase [Pseudomonadota bacterium]
MSNSAVKTVIITGASSGIGEATAVAFARIGWKIVVGARRVEKLTALGARLKSLGSESVAVLKLDVCDKRSVSAFAQTALEFTSNSVDVLVNNAGLALGTDKIIEGKDDDWESMMETNVMGLLRVTRALTPAMVSSGKGHIINLGSIAGFLVYEGGGIYCASKHAVRAITKTLRLELNGTAIRVTSIDPGMVETDFSNVRLKDSARAKAVYQGLKPLSGEDIAECIVWSALRPAHVNIDEIVVMPVAQAAPHKIHRVR